MGAFDWPEVPSGHRLMWLLASWLNSPFRGGILLSSFFGWTPLYRKVGSQISPEPGQRQGRGEALLRWGRRGYPCYGFTFVAPFAFTDPMPTGQCGSYGGCYDSFFPRPQCTKTDAIKACPSSVLTPAIALPGYSAIFQQGTSNRRS